MIKGSKHTIKSRKKMRASSLGQIAWNKNQQKIICKMCKKDFYVSPSRKSAVFCSCKCKAMSQVGQISTEKMLLSLKKGQGWNKKPKAKRECKFCGKYFEVWFSVLNNLKRLGCGKYCSKICFTKSRKGRVSPKKGKRFPHLRKVGGITPLNQKIRTSLEYKEWRDGVFKRDKHTCQNCGKRGVEINADHIEMFSVILAKHNIDTVEKAFICAELWDISNGRTLCVPCHKKTNTFGYKCRIKIKNLKSLST